MCIRDRICRANNINVPIIPGIKPFSTKRQLNILPQRFHLNLPPELVEEVLKCKNNIDIRQVGIDWAIKQTQELIEFGAPCVHFYTMGKVDNVLKVMANFK